MDKQSKTHAWDALKAEATRMDLPKHYTDDLNVHDLAAVQKYGSDKPFLWALRECGTHLLPLDPSQYGGNDRAEVWVEAIGRTWGDGVRWYLWDGGCLYGVDLPEAVNLAKEV